MPLLRREFLQLADTYNPEKHKIAGYMMSEKLDGTRCVWDGGLSRGIKTVDVPWASVNDPKTGKRKGKIKPVATGLWSRYGNPIMAPDWFLNLLPACPLDGELWAGRGNFQLCRSICAGDDPDPRFTSIQYAVYSSPSLSSLFASGEIKNANMVCTIDVAVVEKWVNDRLSASGLSEHYGCVNEAAKFCDELMFLREQLETQNDNVYLHRQIQLSHVEAEAYAQADEFLAKVLDQGGEGLMFRNPAAVWTPKRHKGILKYKPFEDAEAIVVGYVTGKPGKQGNVLGKIGALVVKTDMGKGPIEFEIGSGLTMAEREFATPEATLFAHAHPEDRMPDCFDGALVKRGTTLTFKYRELSDDGIPKEGRYWRARKGVE